MKKILFTLLLLIPVLTATARQRQLFDAGWLFILGDKPSMASPDYNDASWRHLNLPHDWAIEGDFRDGNPSGAGGGALPGGIGWYRKHLTISEEEASTLKTKSIGSPSMAST